MLAKQTIRTRANSEDSVEMKRQRELYESMPVEHRLLLKKEANTKNIERLATELDEQLHKQLPFKPSINQ